MTHDDVKHNADIMMTIIRHNLMIGGNAKMAYEACDPGMQALVRCQLTHREKRMLGIVADDEPDPLEMALHKLAMEREDALLKKRCHVDLTKAAERYYARLKAA